LVKTGFDVGTVLIVDDEPIILKIVAEVIQDLDDIETLLAPDAESALEILKRETPDVVLTDVKLPGIDGVELARRIKATDGMSSMPVLLMSAFGEPTVHRGDGFLQKPFDIDQLASLIERYIGGQRPGPLS
jgi:CheY-like chemotaxis protein